MLRHRLLLTASAVFAVLLLLAGWFSMLALSDAYCFRWAEPTSELRVYLFRGNCTITSTRGTGYGSVSYWSSNWSSPIYLERHLADRHASATSRRAVGPVLMLAGTLGGNAYSTLQVPFWPLLPLLLIVNGWLLLALHRHRASRRRPICPHCGYDLRGCIKRCAECGWTMPYPLVLRLALVRDRQRRAPAAARGVRPPQPSPGKTTTPTDSSVGAVH